MEGADAEAGADPDGDGRDNFTEYAFGGSPDISDAAPEPQMVARSGTTVTWQYLRRADDPALEFTHETSSDLIDWTEIPAGELQVTTEPHPALAGHVWVTAEVSETAEGPRFFRVRGH